MEWLCSMRIALRHQTHHHEEDFFHSCLKAQVLVQEVILLNMDKRFHPLWSLIRKTNPKSHEPISVYCQLAETSHIPRRGTKVRLPAKSNTQILPHIQV